MIENLNKAYYPSKIKRNRNLGRRKKKAKSSTPNIKVRRFQKDFIPVRLQKKIINNDETAQIERLKFIKQREEYEILLKQKQNIQQLKDIQNGIVPEDPEEDTKSHDNLYSNDHMESQQNDTKQVVTEADDLNRTMDVYLDNEQSQEQNNPEEDDDEVWEHKEDQNQQDTKYLAVSTNILKEPKEVLINESDEDDHENEENEQEQEDDAKEPDEKQQTEERNNLFPNRSKSDQIDEHIEKFVIVDAKGMKNSSSKKKNKNKLIPKTIKRIFPNLTDLTAWRKRNHLTKKTRIFKMLGNYQTIKQALYDRGWVENKDRNSPWFDLCWSLKARDIDFDNLKEGQIVNHFRFNGCITTKIGLCRNLGKVINFNNVDIDTFFPKCYSFKEDGALDEFSEQFKITKAECILKRFAKGESVDPDMLDVAMTVCRRSLLDLDDIIDNPFREVIKDSEWEILGKDERLMNRKFKNKKVKKTSLAPIRKAQAKINHSPSMIANKINSKRENSYKSPSIVTLKLPEIENKQMYSTVKNKKPFLIDAKTREEVIKSIAESRHIESPNDIKVVESNQIIKSWENSLPNPHSNLLRDVKQILTRLELKFPQFKINGDKNIWIIKPAGLSRGRGIKVFSHLNDIKQHMHAKEHDWIAQKYIENPMIINNRKFDLRIWVLVTGVNPLTIWFWNKPYIRFPAADYNDTNLNDRFIHLTNNSVAK